MGIGRRLAVATAVCLAMPGSVLAGTAVSEAKGFTWGLDYVNKASQLTRPTQVRGIRETSVTEVDSSVDHDLFVGGDGNVWAYGNNSSGELGIGNTKRKTSAVQVKGISNVVQTATGHDWSMALEGDGTVWSWGLSSSDQLGTGATANQTLPQQITFPSGAAPIVDVAAGGSHGIALDSDGQVFVWGESHDGQLGLGSRAKPQPTPVQLRSIPGMVKEVAAGSRSSEALLTDGRVFAWGNNTMGQLGDGSTADAFSPMQVEGLPPATSLSEGGSTTSNGHTLAMTSAGIYAWGDDEQGQLGDGGAAAPYSVTATSATDLRSLDLVQATAGGAYSLGLDADGDMWAWGANDYGQIGDGTNDTALTPVEIAPPGHVQLVDAGPHGSVAWK